LCSGTARLFPELSSSRADAETRAGTAARKTECYFSECTSEVLFMLGKKALVEMKMSLILSPNASVPLFEKELLMTINKNSYKAVKCGERERETVPCDFSQACFQPLALHGAVSFGESRGIASR
jgi:hypothetical protein